MKIKNVNIYCNPQTQCPAWVFINKLSPLGQIQFFHKVAIVRLGTYSESIHIEGSVHAIRFHDDKKEMAFYFAITPSNVTLLIAGTVVNHDTDSKKALLYWKSYKRSDYNADYLSYTEELYSKLESKTFAMDYLRATIVDPAKKVFLVALKDVLQSHSIDNSDITDKTKLNTDNLNRLMSKKNAHKILTLPDMLNALELYLAVHSVKRD